MLIRYIITYKKTLEFEYIFALIFIINRDHLSSWPPSSLNHGLTIGHGHTFQAPYEFFF